MAQKRWRRGRWISVVAEFEQSGMTQRDFAEHRGIKLSSLQYWIYRLRREEGHKDPPMRFVEITSTESPTETAGAATLSWPGGPILVFNELPEPNYLAALVRCFSVSS